MPPASRVDWPIDCIELRRAPAAAGPDGGGGDPYFALDESVVVDLATNGGALLQEMRRALDDAVGPVAVRPSDGLEQRFRRALHPPSAVSARVDAGAAGGRRSPDRDDGRGAEAAAEALRRAGPPVPLLRPAELALVERGVAPPALEGPHPGGDPGGGDPGGGDCDDGQREAEPSDVAGPGPTGLLAAVLRAIDTGFYLFTAGHLPGAAAPTDDPSDFDPSCLVCASRVAGVEGRPRARELALCPHRSAAAALGSLDRWRRRQCATRQLLVSRLADSLAGRTQAKVDVTDSRQYTADVMRTAHSHASAWGSARCFGGKRSGTPQRPDSPPPSRQEGTAAAAAAAAGAAGARAGTPSRALWDATHDSLAAERRSVAQCELLWRRLRIFCRSTGAPGSADAAAAVECLRELLRRTRVVSRPLFFRWLHLTGHRVIEARDLVRLCLWVRLELQVSTATFQRWIRLPDNKAAGWKVLSDAFE